MPKAKEPYIEGQDRPAIEIEPDTPISELRVRDLVAILSARTVKPHPKFEGQSPLKEFFDKPFPEVASPLGRDPTPSNVPDAAPGLVQSVIALNATLSRLEDQVARLAGRVES